MSRQEALRFRSLDSLRGIAACMVVVAHLWTSGPLTALPFIRNAGLFVDFFFVLSGFVICWNYQHRLTSWGAVRDFMMLRVGRLYPLHLAMLGALLTLKLFQHFFYPVLLARPAFDESASLASLASNLLLIQSLNLHSATTWNEPSWSISAEMWAYLAFAAVCVTLGARTRYFMLAAAVLAAFLLTTNSGMTSTQDYGLLRCLLGFSAGVVTCHAFGRWKVTPGTSGEIAAVAAVVAFVSLAHYGSLAFLAPIVLGCAVFIFAADSGSVSRLLMSAPLAYLGKISYSIYMTHWLLLSVLWVGVNFMRSRGLDLWSVISHQAIFIQVYGRTPLEGCLFTVGFLAVVIVVSAATYRLIEQPGREWSRRLVAAIPRGWPAWR